MAVNLEPLDSLRFYELGPILERIGSDRLELVNTETEIKNIYRVLRVLEPFIRAIAARGGPITVSLDSVGTGTSLIFDNTLPDFFLRSLLAGSGITLTVSADGKEITIASTGAVGTHELSDGSIHTDVAGSADISFVNGNEDDGSFLAWSGSDGQWELSEIGNAGTDQESPTVPQRLGCYRGFQENILNFGAGASIGGRHTMRMIQSGNGITLTKMPTTEDIKIDVTADLGDLANVTETSPAIGAVLTFDGSGWVDQTSFFRMTRTSTVTPADSPIHYFRRSRGTVGSPAAVNSGDRLGQIDFRGHDGSGVSHADSEYEPGTRILGEATENFSTLNNGAKLVFQTTDNGSTILDTRMTIDQDGSVDVVQDLIARTLTSDVATGTAPFAATSTTESLINVHHLDAAGTGRDWDDVEYTRQAFLACVAITGASIAWLTGTTGPSLPAVATGTPPAQSAHYAGRIPASWKAASTVTLKWRFYNASTQTGTNNVLWRVQYNSPGSSGTVGAADTGGPTSNLALNQASGTIIEESLVLSNIAADDLLNVTLSVDNAAGTTATGNMVILDCPWVEITLQGVPDTGAAA